MSKRVKVPRGIVTLLAFVLFARGLVLSGERPPGAAQRPAVATEDQPAWGKPVEGQAISIASAKLTYACGEEIWLDVRMKNVGKVPILDPREQYLRPPNNYQCDICVPGGASAALTEAGAATLASAPALEGLYWVEKKPVEPGGEFFWHRIEVTCLYDLRQPGKYIVSARKNVALPGGGYSTTEAVSNKLEITVFDALADRLREHVKTLVDHGSLDLHRQWITDAALDHLKGLTSLKELCLAGARNVTDARMERIERIASLERLDLRDTSITDAGLKDLSRLAGLREVNVGGTQVTDAGVKYLSQLHALDMLGLGGDAVTDVGLEHLRGLPHLRRLYLGGTRVTDGGLLAISGLTQLTLLDLSDTKIGDAGIAHLKELAILGSLGLENTAVTDAGLRHLEGMPDLGFLYLGHTRVDDAGLASVGRLANLVCLYLDDDAITDAGLENLKGLKNLDSLHLVRTKVTDAGLARLTGLANLRSVDVRWTGVTAGGARNFERVLPRCRVNAEGAH
jgi:hypothetical protein